MYRGEINCFDYFGLKVMVLNRKHICMLLNYRFVKGPTYLRVIIRYNFQRQT